MHRTVTDSRASVSSGYVLVTGNVKNSQAICVGRLRLTRQGSNPGLVEMTHHVETQQQRACMMQASPWTASCFASVPCLGLVRHTARPESPKLASCLWSWPFQLELTTLKEYSRFCKCACRSVYVHGHLFMANNLIGERDRDYGRQGDGDWQYRC